MIQTLADALAERGYDTLTPVQEAVSDPALEGSDLLVSAQTGSGKTVGFGLAIAPTLLDEDGRFGPPGLPMALVVAPTRELAFQVMRELTWLYAKAGARVASCVGGMDMRDERRALERGAHIVVGTPGRLRDHIQRESLDLSEIRAIVLDEADEMLDLGFREDLEYMLGEAPEGRRTLMFSATVPPAIAGLANSYMNEPERVTTLTGRSQHADIAYMALRVAPEDSETSIVNVLRFHDAQNAIVFANTRAAVNRLTARLANRGFAVVALSGELSQTERTHALQAMRDGRARVCVATDVAARGIDLPNLDLVVHAELPSSPDTLLHRSGRTGRAGRKGISALIVPPKFAKKAERILKFAKLNAEWTTAPDADAIRAKDMDRLLEDAAWTEAPSDEEAAFAARLIETYSPEAIAAACLRLHRARLSAPEELSDPDTRPARKERTERAPFGPAQWVKLSVGRDRKAEARWLLPLLCRAGGLDKDAIGAIRIQQSETFVEVAEASAPALFAAVGENGQIEDGVTVTAADGPPPQEARGPRPGGKPKFDKPRRDEGQGERPARKPREDREDRPAREDRPDRGERPDRAPREERPARKPERSFDKPERGPREDRPRRDDKPRKSYGEKAERYGAKPERGGKPDHSGKSDRPGGGFKGKSDRPGKPDPKSDRPGKPGGNKSPFRGGDALDPSKGGRGFKGKGAPGKKFGPKSGQKPGGKPKFGKKD